MPVRAPARTLHVAERTLQAISMLIREPRGLTPKELATRLDVSLSTAYNIVNTLRRAGFAEFRERGIVSIGPQLLELLEYLQELRTTQIDATLEDLRRMADYVGELIEARTYVATWDRDDVEVLYIRGRRGVRELPGLRSGFRGAAHALALGKILLAERPESEWPDYLRSEPLPRFTPYTISSIPALKTELTAVRERRVAYDREEYTLGTTCIAVPIGTRLGDRAAYALAISLPVHRFQAERDILLPTLLSLTNQLNTTVQSPS